MNSKKEIVKIDLNNKKYGGRIYENHIISAFENKYNFKRVFLIRYKNKILNIPWIIWIYIKYHFFFKGSIIFTNHTTWIAGSRSKNLVIVHHIDTSTSSGLSGMFQKFCDYALLKHKQYFSSIVTVAHFWRDKLLDYGFKNVSIIYNSFDLSLYKFSSDEIEDFKQRLKFDDRPIIYLGNCQRQKGVVEVFEALKHLDVNFVTTGIKDVDIDAMHFDLNYKDYRLLLKASSVVLTMSKLTEGWNRTAHEALLCGTPVIGSGTGGMRELLNIGNGYICNDLKQLESMVLKLINSEKNIIPIELKKLNLDYFNNKWSKVLSSLVEE